jgi:dTDP-4-amino-4,6-dideoxygalactose transaminase
LHDAAFAQIAAAVRTLSRRQLSRYTRPGTSETDRFEHELAAFVGTRYALAVNSGTSALVSALAALHVGPGDEVLVPAYTWVSSAAAVVVVGAVPVLVDIDESLTMSPVDLVRKTTPHTKAVMPVHMLNLVCDMDSVMAASRAHKLFVIEDACQAIGVSYHGRCVGSFGDAAAFSFNQHKNISSGEGGAVVTGEESTFTRAAMFHDVGRYTRVGRLENDEPPFVGLNLRMPELSSAILRPQLARLKKQMAKRHERRTIILESLSRHPGLSVSPHNSPDDAAGLSVSFEDVADAVAFAQQPGVSRLADTGRHIYTNWLSIVGRRTFDGRVDPWAHSEVDYSPDACPVTLDILSRTCSISLQPDLPLPMLRRRAGKYAVVGLTRM